MSQSKEDLDPSFLSLHPHENVLYAVNEHTESGHVAAHRFDATTGELKLINRKPSLGDAPCHLAVDPVGDLLYVANHNDGSVAVLPLCRDGRLGEASDRQAPGKTDAGTPGAASHAHCTVVDPTGNYLLVCDKGADEVRVYRIDRASRKLIPHDPPSLKLHSGGAPRHLAFHPDGQRLWVNGEADLSLVACRWEADLGELKPGGTLASVLGRAVLPGESAAEVAVHPEGNYVVTSVRGDDSLVVFRLEPGGELRSIGRTPTEGRTPRHFAFDPSGRFLFVGNQGSDSIVGFRFDAACGTLLRLEKVADVREPACIVFAPATRTVNSALA